MLLFQTPVKRVRQAIVRRKVEHLAIWGFVGFGALFVVALAQRTPAVPFPLAAGIYAFGGLMILVKPVMGIYATVFLTIIGDPVSVNWWPFASNGSDSDSILYVSDGLSISPLEGYLVLTTVALLAHVANGTYSLPRLPTGSRPMALFLGFVFLGLVYGKLTGGIFWIALFEARGLVVLPIFFLLTALLLRTTRQQVIAVWVAVVAINIDSALTLHWYFALIDDVQRLEVDSLVTHPAATHINLLLVFMAAIIVTRGAWKGPLFLLVPMSVMPILVAVLSERRSSVGALVVGLAFVAVILLGRDPQRFWRVVPPVAVLLAAYVAAFWNVEGGVAFPAQAIRGQIASSSASASDQSSDLYREIENINILYTIRSSPLFGIGFGQPFQRPYRMPSISDNFIFWEFITHNSVLWLWMKLGFFGFLTALFTFARSIAFGARSAARALDPQQAVLLTTATGFIVMYLAYAYLDIAWDVPSMILLGAAMGIIARAHDDRTDADEAEAAELATANRSPVGAEAG